MFTIFTVTFVYFPLLWVVCSCFWMQLLSMNDNWRHIIYLLLGRFRSMLIILFTYLYCFLSNASNHSNTHYYDRVSGRTVSSNFWFDSHQKLTSFNLYANFFEILLFLQMYLFKNYNNKWYALCFKFYKTNDAKKLSVVSVLTCSKEWGPSITEYVL